MEHIAKKMEHIANFSAQGNAKIFGLLSTHLYSNKLEAAIREVGTNAIDATREHLLDTPVEITVTGSAAELTVVKCRDWGIGISPARMDEFVATLGSSSKVGDANQNGTFGIGMLSLFGVSEQFTIETTTLVDGELTASQYLVYIGAEGIPTYTRLAREHPDETTGTTVNFPVPKEDARSVLVTVVKLWNLSDRVKIFSGLSGAIVPHFSESSRRQILVDEPGYKVVAFGDDLTNIYRQIVPVVCVGDVIYPVLSYDDSFNRLLRSNQDLWPHNYRETLVESVIPTEDLTQFKQLWAQVFDRDGRDLDVNNANARLTRFHQRHGHAAVLYLQFDKGQIELPASREQLVASDRNATRVMERLFLAIAGVGRALKADFDRVVATGDIGEIYSRAKNIAFLIDSIPFGKAAGRLNFELDLLDKTVEVYSNICWHPRARVPNPVSLDKPELSKLAFWWIFEHLWEQPNPPRLIFIIDPDENRHTKVELERLTGEKFESLGLFIAIRGGTKESAQSFIEQTQLVALGCKPKIYDRAKLLADPKEVAPTAAKKPPQDRYLRRMESVRDAGRMVLDWRRGINGMDLDDFMANARPVLKNQPPDDADSNVWYLPPELLHKPIEVAYYCALAHLFEIEGVLYFRPKPFDKFCRIVALPQSRDLIDCLRDRSRSYLNDIAADCQELGFIPGVSPDAISHPDRLNVYDFNHKWRDLSVGLQNLGLTLYTRDMCSDRELGLWQFATKTSSAKLNGLLLHHWRLLIDVADPAAELYHSRMATWFPNRNIPIDDRGQATTDWAIGIVGRHLPLIQLCQHMPLDETARAAIGPCLRWDSEIPTVEDLACIERTIANLDTI